MKHQRDDEDEASAPLKRAKIASQPEDAAIAAGADPNVFIVHVSEWNDGDDPTTVSKAYWPSLINHTRKVHQDEEQEEDQDEKEDEEQDEKEDEEEDEEQIWKFHKKQGSIDLKWCEECLQKHGA